jgi:Sec-independent protein translocase protein TatA
MLAGPDLLVILAIALIIFGPKKLPAMGEFKKTTEEMKESIGIKELEGIKSNLTGIDLFTDLAEKVSASMVSQEPTAEVPLPAKDSAHGRNSSPLEKLEKEESEKLEVPKEKVPQG